MRISRLRVGDISTPVLHGTPVKGHNNNSNEETILLLHITLRIVVIIQ